MFINIHLESKKRQQNNIAFQVNVFVISQQFITFNTTQLESKYNFDPVINYCSDRYDRYCGQAM